MARAARGLLAADFAVYWRHGVRTAVAPLLVTLAAKAHKMWATAGDAAPWRKAVWALAAAGADLAVFAAAALIFAILLALGRGRGRSAAIVAVHGIALALLIVAAGDYGFWKSTGSALDASLIGYFFNHFSMIRGVLASEVRPATIIGFAALPVLAVWPLFAQRDRQALRARPGTFGPMDRRDWRNVAATLIAMPAGWAIAHLPAIEGAAQFQRLNVHLTLAWDGWRAFADRHRAASQVPDGLPMRGLTVGPQDPAKKRNLLVVVLESHRARSTTPYNPALATTPFMAELASQGARVDRAYTLVPHTTKALIPIFCGAPPKLTPEYEEADHGGLSVACLPKILRDHGYATLFATPAEGSFELNRTLAEQMGFAEIVSREDFRSGALGEHANSFAENNYFGFEDRVLVKPLLDWIGRQKGPWFAGVLTLTAHHPYAVPPSWQKRNFGATGQEEDYLNTLAYTDDVLRQLWQGLVAAGADRNTELVVVGDHGEGFGEHSLFQHDEVTFEEGLRVPLVLVGPDVPAGSVISGLRQNVDIAPTVLQLLGMPVQDSDLPGASLLQTKGHDKLFFAAWPNEKAVGAISGQLKVVDYFGKRTPAAYDLAADPSELHDIYAQPAVKKAADPLRTQALAFRQQTNSAYAAQIARRSDVFVSKLPKKLAHGCDIAFGNGARLLGWQLERDKVRAGDAIWLTTLWHAQRPPGPGWELFTHMNGPESHFTRFDHVAVEGAYPVAQWQQGDYVVDRVRLTWSHMVPSGSYDVTMGLYNPTAGGDRATPSGRGLLVDREGRVVVARIEVDNPARPLASVKTGRSAIPPDKQAMVTDGPPAFAPTLDAIFGGAARVLKAELPSQPAVPGSDVTFRWWFAAVKPLPRYADLFVHIKGPGGRHLNVSHPTVGGSYLPDAWQPNEVIEDVHAFTLPADWPAGPTKVWMGFWDRNAPSDPNDPGAGRLAIETKTLTVDSERKVLVGSFEVKGK